MGEGKSEDMDLEETFSSESNPLTELQETASPRTEPQLAATLPRTEHDPPSLGTLKPIVML